MRVSHGGREAHVDTVEAETDSDNNSKDGRSQSPLGGRRSRRRRFVRGHDVRVGHAEISKAVSGAKDRYLPEAVIYTEKTRTTTRAEVD